MRTVTTLAAVAIVVASCGESRRAGTPTPAPTRDATATPATERPATGAAPVRDLRMGPIASGDGVSGLSLWVRFRGKDESRRLPLPARASVEALDLGPRAAAFTWATDDVGTGIGEGWVLQVDPLRGGTKRMVRGYISGACGFVRPLTPTAAGVGAFWVASGATCDVTKTIFAEADLHYAHPRSATAPGRLIVGATRDATSTYYLSAAPHAVGDVPDPTSCEGTTCTIVRVTAPRWRDRTPGRPFGPHPG